MIDPKDLNAVVVKIRRIQQLSQNHITTPQTEAEKISLDGEIKTWFDHRRGALLHAAQVEARLVALVAPIVGVALQAISANTPQRIGEAVGEAMQAQPEQGQEQSKDAASHKGPSLKSETAKLEASARAKQIQSAKTKQEEKIEKMRAASDRATAQSEMLTTIGLTPKVRDGDLSNTIAGEPESKVTL